MAAARKNGLSELPAQPDTSQRDLFMKKLTPLAVLFILFTAAPVAFSQSTYSFDNFDTLNGVKVYPEPAIVVAATTKKPLKAKKSHVTQVSANAGVNSYDSVLRPTSLSFPPAVSDPAVASSLRGFTTGNSTIDSYVTESATRNGIDPLLLYSVMHQESSFKQRAISPKGARGLMQLMPGTAARYGVTNIFDPKQNIEGGARYMRFLLDRFDGSVTLALAGYNAGEGAVDKYGWRVPPYAETQEYVRRISRRYSLLRDPNAAIYAPSLTRSQLAKLNEKQSTPLNIYERSILTVRLPDGRLQLMSQ
jgi:soluble lytic murein transglycosylase-like protein